MTIEIITIIISILSLVFSCVSFMFSNSSKKKKEYIKMYCEMINNNKYYYIIDIIENVGIEDKDLKNKTISKKLDMYLSYIEMMLAYSFKLSNQYILRDIKFIRNNYVIWKYICDLSNCVDYPVYKVLKERILKMESKYEKKK